jgi:predicted tellurium resistance membrane protein TerC
MGFNWIGTLSLLLGLELVLGVDNVLVIAILVSRLPKELRAKARFLGLSLALLARILLLVLALYLTRFDQPLIGIVSVRDLLLLGGGAFLLWKAVAEIHHVVELKEVKEVWARSTAGTFRAALIQIVFLDLVFSIDSVLTAIGLTRELWVIVAAVTLSFVCVLFYANPIGEFIVAHPTLKILALAFLVTIGITIFIEGLHEHVPKVYIYLPMGFALAVEFLQMRYRRNRQKRPDQTAEKTVRPEGFDSTGSPQERGRDAKG